MKKELTINYTRSRDSARNTGSWAAPPLPDSLRCCRAATTRSAGSARQTAVFAVGTSTDFEAERRSRAMLSPETVSDFWALRWIGMRLVMQ